jgi:nitroreductase
MIENQITESLKNRRSIRDFADDPVSEEQISTIIEAARWAPSWLNLQPWKFIVIDDSKVRDKICAAIPMTAKAGVNDAPVSIAVCVEDYRNSAHLAEDGAAATLYMSLAAHSLGLGTYWVGLYDRKNRGSSAEAKIRRILGVPENYRLLSLLPIGVPAKSATSTRKTLEEIRCHNFFTIGKGSGITAEQALKQKMQNKNVVSFTPTPYRVPWYEVGNPIQGGG